MNLHKSRSDRVFTGLCGGIAETIGVPSMVIRGLALLAIVFFRLPFVMVVYIGLSVWIPDGEAAGKRGGSRKGAKRPGGGYKADKPPFDVSNAQDVEHRRKN